jgi:hypothetical protein
MYEITYREGSIAINKQLKFFERESFFKKIFPKLVKELSTFWLFSYLVYVP